MQVKTMYKILLRMVKKELEQNPQKCFVSSSGEKIFLSDIQEEFKRIISWLYPKLDSSDICIVVRCKNCKHYKKYTLGEGMKSQKYYACDKDKIHKDPEFFCKDGIEK